MTESALAQDVPGYVIMKEINKLFNTLTDHTKSINQKIEDLQKLTTSRDLSNINLHYQFSNKYDHVIDGIEKLFEKIEKLEENIKHYSSSIDTLWECIRDLSSKNSEKKPCKCPVCGGSVDIRNHLTGLIVPAVCQSCKENDLLWR